MTALFELREKVIRFYNRFENYLVPVLRFMLGLGVFMLINSRIGYMKKLDTPLVCATLALICCILSLNAIILIAAGMILLHLHALALQVFLVGAILFALMLLLYFRFSPKCGAYTILTPIAFTFHTPFSVSMTVGLLERPYAALSMVCGTVVYYFLEGVKENEATLGNATQEGSLAEGITMILNQLLANKALYLMCIALIIGSVVTYLIRRLSVDHAWTLAILIGVLVQFAIVVSGEISMGIKVEWTAFTIGTIVSGSVGAIVKFFCFNLDYTRTEHVQFEDDEYYYYVKAVPKIYMSETEKKIKKINGRAVKREEREDRITQKDIEDAFELHKEQ